MPGWGTAKNENVPFNAAVLLGDQREPPNVESFLGWGSGGKDLLQKVTSTTSVSRTFGRLATRGGLRTMSGKANPVDRFHLSLHPHGTCVGCQRHIGASWRTCDKERC
jgi:hypothetical protein